MSDDALGLDAEAAEVTAQTYAQTARAFAEETQTRAPSFERDAGLVVDAIADFDRALKDGLESLAVEMHETARGLRTITTDVVSADRWFGR